MKQDFRDEWNRTAGLGIFEFALTRSRSYTDHPTLPDSRKPDVHTAVGVDLIR